MDESSPCPGVALSPLVVHKPCSDIDAECSPMPTGVVDERLNDSYPQAFPHLWRHRCTSVT